MTKSELTVLRLTANSLFNAGIEIDTDIDWNEVFEESKKQAVCALAYDATKNLDIPSDINEKWFNYSVSFLRKNLQVNDNHNYVHNFMKDINIPYCILKGCASEYYYPNRTLRAMGDVDFLVDNENLEEARKKFVEAGFEADENDHDFHIAVVKGNMDLELHYAVPGLPDGSEGDGVREVLKDIIANSTETKIGDATFMMPTALHHGIVMLLHTYNHLIFEGIGLRHLCDWAVFVNYFSAEDFEQNFKEGFQKSGLWKFARILSATACKYLKMPYKSWIGEIDDALCDSLIADIFDGGNFGAKNNERGWQSQMIAYRGNAKMKKSKFAQLVAVKNYHAAKKFPIFKKCRILYPFGWIFLGVRYIINIIWGRRPKVNMSELAQGAEQRREIYKQFQLFEGDNNNG